MYSKVYSAGLMGIEGFLVEVEVDISEGLPCMELVGALGREVREARERVKSALHHCGISLPPRRITVNLTPADRRKEGGGFDLPIAVAIMKAIGRMPDFFEEKLVFLGELGLDGHVRPVNGVLPLLLYAAEQGFYGCVLAKENAAEATLVKGLKVYAVETLEDIRGVAEEPSRFLHSFQENYKTEQKKERKDFADVNGQESLRRAAEVAAAGMHNLLMVGPPGSGKTMVAERIPGILPEITYQEQLELTKIYSICGLLHRDMPLVSERPFRALHHTVPVTAMIGGGCVPRPGEISLAHRGVLFLDELPEFERRGLEALRQPLETGEIVVSRMQGAYHFPADFMLVAGMNPCPCGHYPDRKECHCTPGEVHRYQSRLSRPLLDRIDLCVEAFRVPAERLHASENNETSAQIRERVRAAQKIQAERFREENFAFNSAIPAKGIAQYCRLGQGSEELMQQVYRSMKLSVRSYHKILKVARTIADLDGSVLIERKHIGEAVSYRSLEQTFYI